MRVELALIIGIVCFCCWCAYILISMNSTVAPPPQIPQRQLQQSSNYDQPPTQSQLSGSSSAREANKMSQLQHYTPASEPPVAEPIAATPADIARSRTSSGLDLGGPDSVQPLQPSRLSEANSPDPYYTLSQGQLASGYQAPRSTNYYTPPGRPSATWPSSSVTGFKYQQRGTWPRQQLNGYYRMPFSRSAWSTEQTEPVAEAQVSSGSLYYPSPNRWPAPKASRSHENPDRRLTPSRRQKVYENEHYEAPYQQDAEPEEAQQESEGLEQHEPAQEEAEEGQGEEGEEEELPVRHTDQRIGARSFNEQQSEANERDRQGRPVRVHHRHLINGRPVPAAAQTVADFEAVVNELDPDQPPENQEYDEESSPHNSQASLAGDESRPSSATALLSSTLSTDGRNQRPIENRDGILRKGMGQKNRRPRESHQHRLSESLTAQQWDDDSAVSSPRNKSGTRDVPSEPKDNEYDLETTTEGPLTEEEAREDEEQPDESDMFVGADRFPFLESDGRRRRKREVEQMSAAKLETKLSSSTTINDRAAALQPKLSPSDAPNSPSFIYALNSRSSARVKPNAATPKKRHHRIGGSTYDDSAQENWFTRAAKMEGMLKPERIISTSNSNLNIPASYEHLHEASNELAVLHDPTELTHKDRDRISSLEDLNIRILADPNEIQRDAAEAHRWPPSAATSSSLPPPLRPPYEETRLHGEPQTPVVQQHGHSEGPLVTEFSSNGQHPVGYNYPKPIYPMQVASRGNRSPLAASSKLKRKKFKRSRMSEEKYKAAMAHKAKKSTNYKKAGMKKAKKKAKKRVSKNKKQFKGSTRGKRAKKGHGQQGAKKGALYYKDKGYKKRGFKKAYKKVEAGDHKIYFDEFRDKDQNKRWKNYKDKHHYSQGKDWVGNDLKKYNDFDAHDMKDRKFDASGSRHKSSHKSKHDFKYKNGSNGKRRKREKL